MNTADLDDSELVALLATLGLMMRLDGQVFSDETERFYAIGDEVGGERFERAAQLASELPDDAAILEQAGRVSRVEARELIFELLYDMAIQESIVPREGALLQQLAELWDLPRPDGV